MEGDDTQLLDLTHSNNHDFGIPYITNIEEFTCIDTKIRDTMCDAIFHREVCETEFQFLIVYHTRPYKTTTTTLDCTHVNPLLQTSNKMNIAVNHTENNWCLVTYTHQSVIERGTYTHTHTHTHIHTHTHTHTHF